MDVGWTVTLLVQQRVPTLALNESPDPTTDTGLTVGDDGWAYRYHLNCEVSDELLKQINPHEFAPTPQAVLNLMGHKKFLQLCATHTPIIRWHRTNNSVGNVYDFRSNPA